MSAVSRFSDIFTVSKEPEDEDIIWADVLKVADEAAERFVQMRETEGAKMKGGRGKQIGFHSAGGEKG